MLVWKFGRCWSMWSQGGQHSPATHLLCKAGQCNAALPLLQFCPERGSPFSSYLPIREVKKINCVHPGLPFKSTLSLSLGKMHRLDVYLFLIFKSNTPLPDCFETSIFLCLCIFIFLFLIFDTSPPDSLCLLWDWRVLKWPLQSTGSPLLLLPPHLGHCR